MKQYLQMIAMLLGMECNECVALFTNMGGNAMDVNDLRKFTFIYGLPYVKKVMEVDKGMRIDLTDVYDKLKG